MKFPVSFWTAAEAREFVIGFGLHNLSFGAVALDQKPPRGASGVLQPSWLPTAASMFVDWGGKEAWPEVVRRVG